MPTANNHSWPGHRALHQVNVAGEDHDLLRMEDTVSVESPRELDNGPRHDVLRPAHHDRCLRSEDGSNSGAASQAAAVSGVALLFQQRAFQMVTKNLIETDYRLCRTARRRSGKDRGRGVRRVHPSGAL